MNRSTRNPQPATRNPQLRPLLITMLLLFGYRASAMAEEAAPWAAPPVAADGPIIYRLPGDEAIKDPLSRASLENLINTAEPSAAAHLSWAYTGHIAHIFFSGGITMGQCRPGPDQQTCLLDVAEELIGRGDERNSLVFSYQRREGRDIHFSHRYEGIPVHGGEVRFRLSPEGDILSVKSSFIPTLRMPADLGDSPWTHLDSFDESTARANIRDTHGEGDITFITQRIYVDRELHSFEAIPMVLASLTSLDGHRWLIYVNAVDGTVISSFPNDALSDDVKLTTYMRYPLRSASTDCSGDGDCSSHALCKSCSNHYTDPDGSSWSSRCVQRCYENRGSCNTSQDCSAGEICRDAQCIPSCNTDQDCDTGQRCSYSICISCGNITTWSDPVCETSGPGKGYCAIPTDDVDNVTPLTVYLDENGVDANSDWDDDVYRSHIAFQRWKEPLWRVRAYHQDVLGMTSWPDHPDTRDWSVGLLYFEDCTANHGDWDDGRIIICNWGDDMAGSDSDVRETKRHMLLAHEFGHWLIRESHPGSSIPPDYPEIHFSDGLNEAIPNSFGAIFPAMEVSPSASSWTGQCSGRTGAATYTTTTWTTRACGLEECCEAQLPYSPRSYFDFLITNGNDWTGTSCSTTGDCEPYQVCLNSVCTVEADPHKNRFLWRRFASLLSEGTDILDEDGEDEDIGSFSGVGEECASEIVWAATNDLAEDEGREEWISYLIDAASTLESDNGSECYSTDADEIIAKALEACGFPTERQEILPDIEIQDGYLVSSYWYDWETGSTTLSQRYFFLMVEDDDLLVRYYRNGAWRTETLYSEIDDFPLGRPAISVYHDAIYFFWVTDDSNNTIYYRYKKKAAPALWYPGLASDPYEIDTVNLYPTGSLAAAAIHSAGSDDTDMLTVLFTTGTTGWIGEISCIDPASGFCGEADWEDMDYDPGVDAQDGISAVWARHIHGAEGYDASELTTASLYVLSAEDEQYAELRLSRATIDMVSDVGEITWEHHAEPPDSLPYMSNQSVNPMGLMVRRSGFADNSTFFPYDNSNYLYMFWQGQEEFCQNKYVSVAYNFGEEDSDETWFTLPADWMMDFSDSEGAVSFVKGYPLSWNTLGFLSVDTDGQAAVSYNRLLY